MATLPTGVYANPTTPLWATAGAGQEFVSPSVVVNDTTPATSQVSIIVNNDNTGAIELNTIPTGTPLNEIRMDGLTNGIGLYTNGEITMVSAPNSTAVLGDLQIVSRQTAGTWNFNNNELSYNYVKQLTGDTTFTQLGENTYSDSAGLNVWNVTSSNSTTTIGDTDIEFYTSSGGSSVNQTFSFTSQLVPNYLPSTGNPDLKSVNARTPIFPNDAQFDPNSPASLLNISGGSGTPYSVQVTNNGLTTTTGIGCSIYKTDGNNLYANNFPFWIELTMFDPSSIQYGLFNTADLTYTNLITQIKNVAGTLSFIPYGGSLTTFVVGDKVRVIYEWLDKTNFIPQMVISKNNVVLTRTILPAVPFGVAQYEPVFYNTTPIVAGYSYTFVFNYGNTSPIIASFNDWEWTTGLGGLYPFNNTQYAPAPSGSSPNSTTYWSIVYLQDGCTFTSPPIIVNQGVSVTINAYKGSRFGLGTLNIYQNNTTLVYTGVVSATWTQTNLGTYVSTGSDTLTFVYSGASNDTLSLQRINLNYNNAVDTLIGGIGRSGTAINMGYGNFLTTPTLQMTSNIINITKPLNMSNQNISNVGSLRTNTITDVGGTGQVNVTANLDMYNNSIGNVFEINVSNSRANNIRSPYGLSNINVLNNLNMSNNIISNANQVNATQVNASSVVSAPNIEGFAGALNIGFSTPDVELYNLTFLTGRGSNFPANMTLIERINQIPAIPTGIIYIQTNFDGFKEVAIPLIPTNRVTDTTGYRLSNPNYLSTTGYTISGKSILTIYDSTGSNVLEQFANSSESPNYFAGTQMILNTTTRNYTYKVYLPSL